MASQCVELTQWAGVANSAFGFGVLPATQTNSGDAMNWQDFVPFTDIKGLIRFTVGVAIVLLIVKVTGLKKYV